MPNTLKRIVIVVGVLAGVAVVVGITLGFVAPQPPATESWYQREIIGQGILTNLEADGGDLLVSLQLMSAEYTPENPSYTTYVFCLNSDRLLVQNTEYNYLDVKTFEVGTWYTLFRKVRPTRYLLLAESDTRRYYPVAAPTYEP